MTSSFITLCAMLAMVCHNGLSMPLTSLVPTTTPCENRRHNHYIATDGKLQLTTVTSPGGLTFQSYITDAETDSLADMLAAVAENVILLDQLVTTQNTFALSNDSTKILQQDDFYQAVVQVSQEFAKTFSGIETNVKNINSIHKSVGQDVISYKAGPQTMDWFQGLFRDMGNNVKLMKLLAGGTNILLLPAEQIIAELHGLLQQTGKTSKLLHKLQKSVSLLADVIEKAETILDGVQSERQITHFRLPKQTIASLQVAYLGVGFIGILYEDLSVNSKLVERLEGVEQLLAITDLTAKETKRQQLEIEYSETGPKIRKLVTTNRDVVNEGMAKIMKQ